MRHRYSKFIHAGMVSGLCMVLGCASSSDDVDPENVAVRASRDSVGPKTLDGPVNTWTWIDVPGTMCGNGSQTGLAINKGTGSDLVIYMAGGGLCWDEFSCNQLSDAAAQFLGQGPLVHSINGFSRAEFERDFVTNDGPDDRPIYRGLLSRSVADNPFRDATYVYIPYCTGDFHSGSTTQAWSGGRTMHYAGRQNLDIYLSQIVSSFPDASHVTLAGASAGGFGSQINYWRVKNAFGEKRVDLVADAAPMFSGMFVINLGAAAWNLKAALPPDCAACQKDYKAIYSYYAKTYPDSRFGLVSGDMDLAMSLGGSFQDPLTFRNNLISLGSDLLRRFPNWRYFIPATNEHGMLQNLGNWTGVKLSTWLDQMRNDSPSWSDEASWGTSCPTGSRGFTPNTADIRAKYEQLGACASVLGAPVTDENTPPDLQGRYVQYTNGSIYWYPGTGAHELHGPIRELWKNWGWERSPLGYPTTDEIDTTAGNGRKNLFWNGGIYTSTTGTFAVHGAIFSRYDSMGAESGTLGLPTSNEKPTGFMYLDRVQSFEHGKIYWSAVGGTSVQL